MKNERPRGAMPPCADSPCRPPRIRAVPFTDLDCIHWLEIEDPEDFPEPRGVQASSVAIGPEEAM